MMSIPEPNVMISLLERKGSYYMWADPLKGNSDYINPVQEAMDDGFKTLASCFFRVEFFEAGVSALFQDWLKATGYDGQMDDGYWHSESISQRLPSVLVDSFRDDLLSSDTSQKDALAYLKNQNGISYFSWLNEVLNHSFTVEYYMNKLPASGIFPDLNQHRRNIHDIDGNGSKVSAENVDGFVAGHVLNSNRTLSYSMMNQLYCLFLESYHSHRAMKHHHPEGDWEYAVENAVDIICQKTESSRNYQNTCGLDDIVIGSKEDSDHNPNMIFYETEEQKELLSTVLTEMRKIKSPARFNDVYAFTTMQYSADLGIDRNVFRRMQEIFTESLGYARSKISRKALV